MTKKRLDILVHEKGLVSTRAQATMMIKKSGVLCNGVLNHKPGVKFDEDIDLELVEKDVYVSRGAYKLVKALDHFEISPKGLICADIGASTGGFTQVLLERGAKKVFAVDVGHSQLSKILVEDDRVVNMEGVNARYPIEISEKVDLIVSDLSHISMLKVLPEALKIMKAGAPALWLIKPQFEAGPSRIGKNGIVSEKHHERILKEVSLGIQALGVKSVKIIESPIKGKKGNKEYLFYFICPELSE